MICGLPAEVMEQLMQTAGHLKATYRVASATGEREGTTRLSGIAKEFPGHTRALTNFPNQLRWS